MPITKGAGNPDWSRDETLLALDLLYRHGGPIHRGHPDVQELSALLRNARIHPMESRRPSFRNSDGVGLKLQNLLSAIDTERGLSSSAMDRALVEEFPKSKAKELAEIAVLIRQAIADEETVDPSTEDETFPEGQLLTSSHRRRDQRLRRRLVDSRSDDQLVCEICDFAPPPFPRILRESFFEAHHVRPLSERPGEVRTNVKDMALVCACCHRFIHRLSIVKRVWISIAEARSARLAGE